MNKEDLIALANIYNNLLDVSTKGEDTLRMAKCLEGLKSFIFEQQAKMKTGGE
jgi:hypothetical protein